MKDAIHTMTQYPVGEYYQQSVHQLIMAFEELIDSGLACLTQTIVSLDSYLLAARRHSIDLSNSVSEAMHNVTSHPNIVYLKNTLDLTPYVKAASNKLTALRMPEEYTAAIYRASSRVNNVISDVMNMESMKQIKQASNEIYQEGVWAYKYWQVEDNLEKHLRSIATLLKEIIEEEMDIYTRHFRFLQRSHVTVWDPEHGEIQAEISLPVAMETLDSMPDVTPLIDQYNEVMNSVPNMDTVEYFYNHYVPESKWWSNESTAKKDQLMTQLDEFTPSEKPNRMLKKKLYKRARKTVSAM